MENAKSTKLKLEDLTIAKLDELNQAKLIVGRWERNTNNIIKKELRYPDFSSMKKVRRHSSARTRVLKSVLHIREDTPAGSEFYRSRSRRTALLQLHRGETQSPWLHFSSFLVACWTCPVPLFALHGFPFSSCCETNVYSFHYLLDKALINC